MNIGSKLIRGIAITFVLALAVACRTPIAPPNLTNASITPIAPASASLTPADTAVASIAPTLESSVVGLTGEQVATLRSAQKVDDYPLYTVQYHGSYEATVIGPEQFADDSPRWGCSLFAAMGDPNDRLYGRNFDWSYSPAALVFTSPADGYASASMVDLAYLFTPTQARSLSELPLRDRKPLLQAPLLPFDGMNDQGLVVGMAAVPTSAPPRDPAKKTVGSLRVIREMLDHARNVDEAVDVMRKYNIDMEGGPPIHYLIADAMGRAVLVELVQGKVTVIRNETAWHLATNFLRSEAGGNGLGHCWRYDKIYQRLDESGGRMTSQGALDLLSDVSQDSTQWSIIYGMSTGSITVAMGHQYAKSHTLHLERAGP